MNKGQHLYIFGEFWELSIKSLGDSIFLFSCKILGTHLKSQLLLDKQELKVCTVRFRF